jgi:hypothetical protein
MAYNRLHTFDIHRFRPTDFFRRLQVNKSTRQQERWYFRSFVFDVFGVELTHHVVGLEQHTSRLHRYDIAQQHLHGYYILALSHHKKKDFSQ